MAEMELEAGEIVSDSETHNNNVVVVKDDNKDEIAQDVLLVAAEVEFPGNAGKEAESDAEGMCEEDSDPLEDDSSSSEDDDDSDVNAADIEKSHIDGAEELEKMVQRAKDGGDSDDDDDAAVEPPRTANEVTVPCFCFFLKCCSLHCLLPRDLSTKCRSIAGLAPSAAN